MSGHVVNADAGYGLINCNPIPVVDGTQAAVLSWVAYASGMLQKLAAAPTGNGIHLHLVVPYKNCRQCGGNFQVNLLFKFARTLREQPKDASTILGSLRTSSVSHLSRIQVPPFQGLLRRTGSHQVDTEMLPSFLWEYPRSKSCQMVVHRQREPPRVLSCIATRLDSQTREAVLMNIYHKHWCGLAHWLGHCLNQIFTAEVHLKLVWKQNVLGCCCLRLCQIPTQHQSDLEMYGRCTCVSLCGASQCGICHTWQVYYIWSSDCNSQQRVFCAAGLAGVTAPAPGSIPGLRRRLIARNKDAQCSVRKDLWQSRFIRKERQNFVAVIPEKQEENIVVMGRSHSGREGFKQFEAVVLTCNRKTSLWWVDHIGGACL